jgi:DedD protein
VEAIMENRVRDLEQLEERDPEDRGRRIGTIVMATLGIVALTFAVGVVVGKAAEPSAPEKDPLDQLDRVAAATMKPSLEKALAPQGKAPVQVDAMALAFPKTLTEDEDRPEVLAALAAAEQEEANLAAAANVVDDLTPSAAELTVPENDIEESDEAEEPAVLPAVVAAGSARRTLARTAEHDELVAAVMPEGAPQERAPHGGDGEYTLQVISYDAPGPAQAFASNLRAKGHEAFVASADIEGRGRYYRVRIGPFKVRQTAEAYRHKFEEQEHMNTIVVRRAKDDTTH